MGRTDSVAWKGGGQCLSHISQGTFSACCHSACLVRRFVHSRPPVAALPAEAPQQDTPQGALDEVSMVILVCSLAPACSLATAANYSVSVAGTNCLRHHEEPIRGGLVAMRPAADGSICTRAVSRYF